MYIIFVYLLVGLMFSLNSFSLSKLVNVQRLGHTRTHLCYLVYAISNTLVFIMLFNVFTQSQLELHFCAGDTYIYI